MKFSKIAGLGVALATAASVMASPGPQALAAYGPPKVTVKIVEQGIPMTPYSFETRSGSFVVNTDSAGVGSASFSYYSSTPKEGTTVSFTQDPAKPALYSIRCVGNDSTADIDARTVAVSLSARRSRTVVCTFVND